MFDPRSVEATLEDEEKLSLAEEVAKLRDEILLILAGSPAEQAIRDFPLVDVVRFARQRLRKSRLQMIAMMTKRGG